MRKLWTDKIHRALESDPKKIKEMKSTDRVCSRHFNDCDYSRYYEHKMPDGTICKIQRGKAELREGAVPCIFPEYPVHYRPKQPKPRKDPSTRKRQETGQTKRGAKNKDKESAEDHDTEGVGPAVEETSADGPEPEASTPQVTPEEPEPDRPWNLGEIQKLNLPAGWVCCNTLQNHCSVLTHINQSIQIDKSITLKSLQPPQITIRGVILEDYTPKNLNSIADAQNLLNFVNNLRICEGTGRKDKPFSVCCKGATPSLKQRKCGFCTAERDRLRKVDQRLIKRAQRQDQKKKKITSRMKSLKKSKLRLMAKVKLETSLKNFFRLCFPCLTTNC